MLGEVWKAIEDYEGHYEVSNFGRVKSLARHVERNNGTTTFVSEKIRKTSISKNKFRDNQETEYVTLTSEGVHKTLNIARLVCAAFHGLPPAGKEHVIHWDLNRLNNVDGNLFWGDAQDVADLRKAHAMEVA